MSGAKRTLQVSGNGLNAWASALFALKSLSGLVDDVCVSGGAATGAGPSIAIAQPRARAFLSGLGLGEEVLFREADACFLLGTTVDLGAPFVLAHATYGAPANSVPFHHFWKRMNEAGLGESHDAYSFGAQIAALGSAGAASAEELEAERALTENQKSEIATLNAQLAALRKQLASLQEALDAAEAKDIEQQAQIENLSTRLNAALAAGREPPSPTGSDFQLPGTRRWYPASNSSDQSRISRPVTPHDDGVPLEPGMVRSVYVFGSAAGHRTDFSPPSTTDYAGPTDCPTGLGT